MSSLGMDGSGDFLPTFHLCLSVDAGCIRIPITARSDRSRLGDDQSRRGSLGIVIGIELIRDVPLGGTAARERGHEDPVWQIQKTE